MSTDLHKAALVIKLPSFGKFIPTDMDWHGTYEGGYCEVRVSGNGPEVGGHHTVYICGTDDTALVRFFDNWADALRLFNSLRYIQSDLDLTMFSTGVGENNNGWPTARRISAPAEFAWPPPSAYEVFDGVDARYLDSPERGSPIPW